MTKAAVRLHLSQPTVSAQLSKLRELFEDPLLLPAQRGMTPTAKALELYLPLQQALNQVRETLTTHQNFEPSKTQLTLKIACTDYMHATLGLSIINTLKYQAPYMKIALCSLEPARLETQMAAGHIDLALMSPNDAPSVLRCKHLYIENYVLIGRNNHPHLFEGMRLENYVQLSHVVVSLDGGQFATDIDKALKMLGYARHVALSVNSFLLIPEIVATSDLVALVPKRLVAKRKNLTVVTSPINSTEFDISMLWHERNHSHSAHHWIREAISQLSINT